MIDIEKLARLVRIALGEDEKKRIERDFEAIPQYISKLKEAPLGEEKIFSPEHLELKNVMREDVNPHESGIFTNNLLSEAPEVYKDYIKVKKIL